MAVGQIKMDFAIGGIVFLGQITDRIASQFEPNI
jgi:hypothetical protein